jgi:hypothetical protein
MNGVANAGCPLSDLPHSGSAFNISPGRRRAGISSRTAVRHYDPAAALSGKQIHQLVRPRTIAPTSFAFKTDALSLRAFVKRRLA